jgi:hypothetical protein
MSGGLIGGVVGATIGFFVGGPTGAMYGFSLGSAAGGLLMPGQLPHVEGPRLSDLRAQSSEYGRPIPIVYGTVGLQGNVIWASDLVEVKTDTTTGGKGGPTQTTTNYTYFGNFAVAICDGPIDQVLRIWAGPEKRLIYDSFNLEGGQVRIYRGTEDQLPDPMIEQYLGVGNVPAYRGTCYAVFENLPLANDGNRIPFLTFEVTTGGKTCGDNYTVIDGYKLYDPPPLHVSTYTGSHAYGRAAQDTTDNMLYYLRVQGTTLYLDKTDPVNKVFGASLAIGDTTTYSSPTMALNTVERTVAILGGSGVNWAMVDLNTFTVTSTGTFANPKADVIVSNGAYAYLNMYNVGDADDWGRTGAVFGGYLIDCDGVVAAVSTTQPLTLNGAQVPGVQKQFDVFDPVARRLISLSDSCYYDFGTGTLVTTTTAFPGGGNAVYDPYVRRIFCNSSTDILMINPEEITPASIPVECIILSGSLLYSSDPTDVVNLHFSPMIVPVRTPSNYLAFVDGIPGGSGLGDVLLFQVGTGGGGMPLWKIVSDLSDRSGMSSYDVSELTDIVDGYLIAKQCDVRSAIDALRPAYYFDAVESQGIVKFVKRGGTTVTVIADEDLAATDSTGQAEDPLVTVRKQEVELPRTINVNYMLAATDYEAATKTAKRLVGFSLDETTLEMPLVLSDTKAQEIADVNLHTAWAGRLTYTFSAPRKYSQLEPTDLVLVKGNLMRLTKVTATPTGVLKCEAISDDSSYYAPHVIVTETPPVVKTVFVPGQTILELM